MLRRLLLGFSVGVALSCATADRYLYRPTELATATTDGYPTARYPVPPEQPRGEVYVTSFGPSEAQVAKGQKTELLAVRMAVNNNNGDGPWTVDTRQQLAELPGEGESRPAYVNTGASGSPLINVQPGARQVIDLYYVLPPGYGPERLRSFSVLWSVQTSRRVVAGRTEFARERLEPPPPAYHTSVSLGLGWGPFWWYDPFYPTATFVHPVIVRAPHPVFVHVPRYVRPAPRFARPVIPAQPSAPVWRGMPPGAGPRHFHGAPGPRRR